MLQKDTFHFLDQLKQNNNKEWMDANRKLYEASKADFEGFVTQIITGLSQLEPMMSELTAKQCVFRLNRDVRFSNDKSPYKTNFGAAFSIGGKKSEHAGFYLHLSLEESFIGGGCWMPSPQMLKNIRQEIDYGFQDFSDIINDKKFKKLFPVIKGDALKKAPQGYDTDNPAIEFIKHKSFVVSHPSSMNELTKKNAVEYVVSSFETIQPFVNFLNRGLE